MSCCIYWVWTFHVIFIMPFQPVTTTITWEAETRIIRIGETIVLICTIHEVEVIDIREPRQWYARSSLVCYNGKPTNPLKYMESLYKNKFKLLIFNVTETDLNRDYQCLYSFDVYSKTLSITEENFEYPPTENTTNLEYSYTTDGNLSVKLHMEKVFPLPNCTIEFEDFQLMFEEIMYTKNGLYYEVYLVHESHIVFNESAEFNVTCQLLQPYFIKTGIIKVTKGGTNVVFSNDHPTKNVLGILVAVAICIAVVTVVVCYIHVVKRRTHIPHAEGYQIAYGAQVKLHPESFKTEPESPTPEEPEVEQLTKHIED